MASGILVAARCAQLSRLRASGNGHQGRRGFGLAVGGLAVAWISMLALVGPLLVDHEIDASNAAAADGNLPSAVSHAENAHKIEPWATSPYKQLGLLAELEGNYPAAIGHFDKAIDREEDSWLLYYLRARVEHRAGEGAAAQADFEEALRLNPEEKCLAGGFEGCG
jgi:tetratricopeptide (TPR) repeat protein